MLHTIPDPKRYILLDSARRNRVDYPNPGNFVVPFNDHTLSSFGYVADPVLAGYPVFNGFTDPLMANTTTTINIVNPATTVNLYVCNYLQIGTESRKIVSFTPGAPAVVVVSLPFSVMPGLNVPYTIRQFVGAPILTSFVMAPGVPANSCFTIQTGLGNGLAGKYIQFTSGPNTGLFDRIISYDTITGIMKTAAFPNGIGGGDTFEIYNIQYDNSQHFHYGYGITNNEALITHKIRLIDLMIPDTVVFAGAGGSVRDYPYLLVEFHAVDSGSIHNTIQSNNPDSIRSQFVVPMDNQTVLGFSHLHLKCDMIQYLKFKPTSHMILVVRLPDGSIIKFAPDTVSPFPVNKNLQITALFETQRDVGQVTHF